MTSEDKLANAMVEKIGKKSQSNVHNKHQEGVAKNYNSNSKNNSNDNDNRISVFVRVRPLTPSEKEAGLTILDGLTMTTTTTTKGMNRNSPDEDNQNNISSSINDDGNSSSSSSNNNNNNAVALVSSSSSIIDGFTGILGTESSNRDVFETCFSDRLSTVLQGGTASLFCYGYTGGGKTHTVVGYGEERGLFFLAAEKLLEDLNNNNSSSNGNYDDDERLFLRATACEIYLDSVFDILGPEKEPCVLRTGADGALVISREAQSEQLQGIATATGKGEHATLVTRAPGLRAVPIHKAQDLDAVSKSCIQQRACGTSTENNTSSRSHAILRLEVVSKATNRLQDELQQLKAELPALKNALDNARTSLFHAEVVDYVRVLRQQESGGNDAGAGFNNELQPSDLVVDFVTEDKKFALVGVKDGKTPRTIEQWSECLSLSPLKMVYAKRMKEYSTEAERIAVMREKEAEQSKLKLLVAEKEKQILEVTAELDRFQKTTTTNDPCSSSALGGSMLLVDLAGADYDHRGGKAQKESTSINKSLLALKECFRALSSSSSSSDNKKVRRPPFRDSKLTRVLEDSLAAPSRNKETVSVMLVNVCPNSKLKSGTINALRYGQMYSSSSSKRNKLTGPRVNNKASSLSGISSNKANSNNKENVSTKNNKFESSSSFAKFVHTAALTELRRIYKQYVPEKSEEETEAILKKFKGRETWLLEKVKQKYGVIGKEEEDNLTILPA